MKPGRPSQPRLTQDAILTEALALLDQGEAALTLRALAARLNVTPMAVQHHIGTRDALIHALADRCYAAIDAPTLHGLLAAYADAIRRHPNLTLALFRIAGPLPQQAQRITDALHAALLAHGLTTAQATLWRDILVDWAHGMALAQSPADPTTALETLLAAITPGRSAAP